MSSSPTSLTRLFIALMALALALQDLTHGLLLSNLLPMLATAAAVAIGLRGITATVAQRDLAQPAG